ncbi:MAG: hypothetical protein IJ055_06430, partial [Oscillospiraceae bacterium]|nr:hypothetical protein [Oscillospiraceae bacterium]
QHSYDVLLPFAHRFSFSSCHKFSASCDINSILPQFADFLQTFFQRLAFAVPAIDVFAVEALTEKSVRRNPDSTESQYVRSAPDRRLKLLRTSQKWLQSFRKAGLRKNYPL